MTIPVPELKARLRNVFSLLQQQQRDAMVRGEKFRITDPLVAHVYFDTYGQHFAVDWRGMTSENALERISKSAIAEFKRRGDVGKRANGRKLPAWVDTDDHGQWWLEDIVHDYLRGNPNARMLARAVYEHYFERGRQQRGFGTLTKGLFASIDAGTFSEDDDGNWWFQAAS
jgi:hypothetical protein